LIFSSFLDFLHQDTLLVAESKSQSSCKGDPCQIAKLWNTISTPHSHLNTVDPPRPLFLICGAGSKKDINGKASTMSFNGLTVYLTFWIDYTNLWNTVWSLSSNFQYIWFETAFGQWISGFIDNDIYCEGRPWC
jgi:hypothetical protein